MGWSRGKGLFTLLFEQKGVSSVMHDIIRNTTQTQDTKVRMPLECGDKDSAMEPNSSSMTPPTLDEMHQAYTEAMRSFHRAQDIYLRAKRNVDAYREIDKLFRESNEHYQGYKRAKQVYLAAVEQAREGGAV